LALLSPLLDFADFALFAEYDLLWWLPLPQPSSSQPSCFQYGVFMKMTRVLEIMSILIIDTMDVDAVEDIAVETAARHQQNQLHRDLDQRG